MQTGFDDPEVLFNSTTREFVIYLLLFIGFHLPSYVLVSLFRKRITFYASDYEDAIVYRVSFWFCTISFATSIEAALLLPISIISNEVLLIYPNSYYINWLNSSLIQGLWNSTFLFSNISLFILLPFAYFFTESQGFSGSNKGIKARLYETFSVLGLLALLILGMMYILTAICGYKRVGNSPLFGVSSYYLPFLYSCVSFVGAVMLLLFTPFGVAHLFSVLSRFLKTEVVENLSHNVESFQHIPMGNFSKFRIESARNERNFRGSSFRRSISYPLVLLILLVFTVLAVLMVALNTFSLLFGIKALPVYSQQFSLGDSSLSALGPPGASLGIILILYLWCSSVVGLYSMPIFRRLRPKVGGTSMTHIIGNCALLLILSSALPVLVCALGMTNFDLLGNFGKIHWLGNFYIIVFYNVMFSVTIVVCIGTKITATVRQELTCRLYSIVHFTDISLPIHVRRLPHPKRE